MATYNVVNAEQLDAGLTDIADAIREKTGDPEKIPFPEMARQLRKLPGPIVATAAGNPTVLSDATDLKLRGLRIYGRTTQDGTPTPEAPVPLVSAGDGGSLGVTVAGKNLLDLSGSTPGYFISEAGVITEMERFQYTKMIPLTVGIYTISVINGVDQDSIRIHVYDGNGNWIRHAGRILTEGTLRFEIKEGESSVRVSINKRISTVQIESGSTATEYEPYKEQQTLTLSTPNGLPGIPVTSGGNYTDETGQQWICDEVDFARGVYVQRVKKQTITTVRSVVNYGYGTAYIINLAKPEDMKTGQWDAGFCNMFIVSKGQQANNYIRFGANDNEIYVYTDEEIFANKDSTNAYFAENPVSVQYILAELIETPLSDEELAAYATLHTNYPNTTILNDGGAGMEVDYVADTKLYIDNKVNAMAAAIVNS